MRADRLISLMMLLQERKRMTAKALSEELEVSIRTIYRDIDALSLAGIPVYAVEGPGGGFSLVDSYRTSLTGLARQEIQAFFMLTVPGPLADLGIAKQLKSTILKLTSALPGNTTSQAEYVKNRLYLDPARWFQNDKPSPFLKLIQEAVWNDKKIEITYKKQSSSGEKQTVSPYALGAKAGVWYLVAETDRGMRVYRVSRIREIKLLDSGFSRDSGFELETFWKLWVEEYKDSLPEYRVRMEVEEKKLSELRNVTRPDFLEAVKTGTKNSNDRTVCEFVFERMEEARMHILGLGDAATVLDPDELKESLIEFASKISRNYQSRQ
jgi:predicted DNA-binding transcriptional regulator YafY